MEILKTTLNSPGVKNAGGGMDLKNESKKIKTKFSIAKVPLANCHHR